VNKVLHISTECYPAAKAGGMGDVVGALPIYLPQQGIEASVIIPKYDRRWFSEQTFETVHKGTVRLGDDKYGYAICQAQGGLTYPFYCVDIPGLFDREDIYLGTDGHGYKDEAERYLAFQISVLQWLVETRQDFDLLHCHDHMTGLIPFFIKACPAYISMAETPTIFTIHNGQYRGVYPWSYADLLPDYDPSMKGLLEWDDQINSLASAIKCAWQVNTVSPSYMHELMYDFDTLTPLMMSESKKCTGVINGIDDELWDPASDKYLSSHLEGTRWKAFKNANKTALLKENGLKSRRPLLGFIGRMAHQKGADILAGAIEKCLGQKLPFATIILGSGDKGIEQSLVDLAARYPKDVAVIIAYDEALARKIYAGSDFLLMPSRFEPCGLNQMYAMRYGTIPIVSHVGGLKDTVPDIANAGNGIVSRETSVEGFGKSIARAVDLYKDKKKFNKQIAKVTDLDWSWNNSAQKYAELYRKMW